MEPVDTLVIPGYPQGMATETIKRAARSLAERGLVRLSVDLPVEDANRLEEVSRRSGYNKVTTLMRAIRLLADLDAHERGGGEVILTGTDGTRERLRLL